MPANLFRHHLRVPVEPWFHKKFMNLCALKQCEEDKIMRCLVALYVAGRIKPKGVETNKQFRDRKHRACRERRARGQKRIGYRPQKRIFIRMDAPLRDAFKEKAAEKDHTLASILRGLAEAFVKRDMSPLDYRWVLTCSSVKFNLGYGGGWKRRVLPWKFWQRGYMARVLPGARWA